MGLHSVVVTNLRGIVILAKYWDPQCQDFLAQGTAARSSWERKLWAVTQPWPHPTQSRGVGCVDDTQVVWGGEGELVVIVAGEGDYDELILHDEVLPIVTDLLGEFTGNKYTASSLLHTDTFGKMMLALDEMQRDGRMFHTCTEDILRMAKLRKPGKE